MTFGEAVMPNSPAETSALFMGSSSTPGGLTTSFSPSGLSAITLECWVNGQGLAQTGNPRVIANSHTDNVSTQAGFELWLQGGNQPRFCVGTGGGAGTNPVLTSGTNIAGQGWYYICATWDGTMMRLYVNGAGTASTVWAPGSIGAGPDGFALGRNPNYTNNDYWNGLIAQAAIYEYALSPGAIAARWNAIAGVAAPALSPMAMSSSALAGAIGTGSVALAPPAMAGTSGDYLVTAEGSIALGSLGVFAPFKPPQGVTGWDLYSTLQQQAAYAEYYKTTLPMACPHDGEPLREGPPSMSGVLYCPYDGFQYPRDWDAETMSGM